MSESSWVASTSNSNEPGGRRKWEIVAWANASRFAKIDRWLEGLIASEKSQHELVEILTVTHPSKSQLKKRKAFVDDVRQTLIVRGVFTPDLLEGID